ncbi:hypothetical protein ABT354_22255 [Streptomyces sp. NPDC000594]
MREIAEQAEARLSETDTGRINADQAPVLALTTPVILLTIVVAHAAR